MYVKNIEWIDESCREAEVEISDGKYSVVCFSQPFIGEINNTYKENIVCYDSEYIFCIDIDDYYVERIESSFQYILRGKIFNLDEKLLKIGELTIDLSNVYMPGDIKKESFVEIRVNRLDLY